MTHELFTKLDLPAEYTIAECPCCSSDGVLYQFQKTPDGPASKVVMCANGDRFGPQDGVNDEGCLLYMPPEGHYQATIREAVSYWNSYCNALQSMRRKNAWARHSALRTKAVDAA